MKHRLGAALVLATALAASTAPAASAQSDNSTQGLRKAVSPERISEHLRAFQSHATVGGNRVASSPGYQASANYVEDKLEAAGYTVTRDQFQFVYNADIEPPVLSVQGGKTYTDGPDFASMTFSPNGDTTAPVWAVDIIDPTGKPDNTSSSGCQRSDFAGFPTGAIALIQRGNPANVPTDPDNGAAGCSFELKARNAAGAGASGVIIMNEGQPGRQAVINGTLGGPVSFDIPVVGATYDVGKDLTNNLAVKNGPTDKTARLKVTRINETRTTENVIAELPKGGLGGDASTGNTMVVGAHLDSVPRGAGINDNGSGSGTILEIAEQMAARDTEPKTNVRFMWYSAEEFGLLGSEAYVDELSDAEKERIKAMLNFDMVGSPNYVRFVYDGDNSAFPVGPGAAEGPEGSGELEAIFANYFSSQGLASAPTPFSGRSDYGPFIAEGIPAGGLFTGAEGAKTAEQAAIYGGTAGEAYDKCYHLACDTFDNVNQQGLSEMSDAAAHATLILAKRDFDRKPLTNPAPLPQGAGDGGGGGLHDDHDHDPDAS